MKIEYVHLYLINPSLGALSCSTIIHKMKDNIFFMDKYFLGIEFRYPSQQIGPPVMWFKPENFRKVLSVCKEKGVGVTTIEVYKGGYADTLLAEDFGGNPYDVDWYTKEYEKLVVQYCADSDKTEVLFSGWYVEPLDIAERDVHNPKPKWWQKLFSVFTT